METNEYNDLPVEVILKKMEELISNGFDVLIKFKCLNCGSRQTSDVPNKFFTEGYSCEECGKITYPKIFGFAVAKRITIGDKINEEVWEGYN